MDKVKVLQDIINTVFNHLHISPQVEVEEKEDFINVTINGENLSFLIGYRGESLYALQNFLVSALSNSVNEWIRVSVDINDYKKERMEKIESITRNFIDKVRFFGKEIEMSPMNPSERFIVHNFVNGYDDIVSESVGDRANRRVVLKPAKPLGLSISE